MALHYVDAAVADLFGAQPFRGPFPIGHECVAEVVACGSAVTEVQQGDVVVVPWSISCGACRHCQASLTARCMTAGKTYVSAYGGSAASIGLYAAGIAVAKGSEQVDIREPTCPVSSS